MAHKTFKERIGGWLTAIESRWNLWSLIQGTGVVASFAIPAWAAHAAEIFSQYAPFSWVIAGGCGIGVWVIARLALAWAVQLRVRAAYDAKLLERGSTINPLESVFERKRIFIDDLVLPSWAYIDGKTFVDCDLIGPANIYFLSSNTASPIRPPKVDAVWLEPNAKFNNGFVFNNCIFRNCSFQRITMFASVENFHNWKDNPNVSWISIPPTEAHIQQRLAQAAAGQQLGVKLTEERELLEHKPEPKVEDGIPDNEKPNSP